MTMYLLCQETRDACWDSTESLGSLGDDSLAEEWKGSLESQLSQQAKAFLSPWTGCDRKGEGCGWRHDKEEECEQAEVSEEDLRVSSFEARIPSFECESACLSPSNSVAL